MDLYYASELVGIIGTGSCNKETWQELKSDILYMHRHPDPEAKQYALQCLAATRSSDFESILWQLLENESQQVHIMCEIFPARTIQLFSCIYNKSRECVSFLGANCKSTIV